MNDYYCCDLHATPTIDTPAEFRPAKGRPHIAALLSRPSEEREFAVIAYRAEPKHRAS